MLGIRHFFRDTRGGIVERVAVMAGAIALASLGSAHFLDVASRDPNSKLYALFNNKPNVDYTATATIRSQAGKVTLDPCTGRAK